MAKRFLAAVALAMGLRGTTATTQMLRQQIHASRNERALHAQPTHTTKGIQIARATVRPEQTGIEAGLIANRCLRTAAEPFVTQMSGYAMIADQPLLMILGLVGTKPHYLGVTGTERTENEGAFFY